MLGFHPVGDGEASGDLGPVNSALKKYDSLHSLFDAWLVIALSDINLVYKWRLDAEKRMRSSGKPGLTDAQVEDFINRFMPAYQAYLPRLYNAGQGPGSRKIWPPGPGADLATSLVTEGESAGTALAPVLKVNIDGRRLPLDFDFI